MGDSGESFGYGVLVRLGDDAWQLFDGRFHADYEAAQGVLRRASNFGEYCFLVSLVREPGNGTPAFASLSGSSRAEQTDGE